FGVVVIEMLDELQLSVFANHHHHFIGIEERFHKRRLFLCRKHFKAFELQAVIMPETRRLKFFLHQEMYPGRNAVYVMKFEPGDFFIQNEVMTKVSINQISYGPRHICAKKFFRDQVTFRKIIYQENLGWFEPAQD